MSDPLEGGMGLEDSGLPPDPSDSGVPFEGDEQTPAATPDTASIQKRLEELEKELSNRDKRLSDTQNDWHRLNAEKMEAQRRADQAAQFARENAERASAWERWGASQQQQQNNRPVDLSDDEREALLTNPDYLNQRLYEAGRSAYDAISQETVPVIRQLQQQIAEQRSAMAPMWDQAADLAAYRAEQIATQNFGMSVEEYRGHFDSARQALWQAAVTNAQQTGGDPYTKYNNLRANPTAVAMATQWVKAQSGGNVAPTYTPPLPKGAGNNQTQTPSRGQSKSREQSDIEKAFKVNFSPEEAKAIRERSRATAQTDRARNQQGAW